MSRPLVIANPAAGRGGAKDRFRRIAEPLVGRVGPVDVHWTGGPGDALETARREGGRRSRILALGGDGTVSEAARGLAEAGEEATAALGILPCGTGNDFARGVGVPAAPLEAVRLLDSAKPLPTDLGVASFSDDRPPRRFLNSLSVGLAAAVNLRTRDARGLGRASYAVNAVREVFGHAAGTWFLGFDDQPVRPRILVNVSFLNSGRFGGGITLVPDADAGDGKLDAVRIGPMSPVGWADAVRRLRSGSHFERRELERQRVESTSIRSDEGPLLLEMDGEVVEAAGTLRVGVAAGAIRVLRSQPAA